MDESGLCETRFSTLDLEVDLILLSSWSKARFALPRLRPFDDVSFAPVLILLRRDAFKKRKQLQNCALKLALELRKSMFKWQAIDKTNRDVPRLRDKGRLKGAEEEGGEGGGG